MKPSRRTQPYRQMPGRTAGPAMDAMRRGATFDGQNPSNLRRALMARHKRVSGGRVSLRQQLSRRRK